MVDIVDRATKGAPLTHAEMDTNLKQGVKPKVANYTLTIADNRDLIECNSASPLTVTLADAQTMINNSDTGDYSAIISNIGSANVTIARTGANTISGETSVTLYPFDSVMVKANSAGTGYTIASAGLGALVTSGLLKGATVWTSATDGAGSGADADLLDGMQPTINPTANTIMQRDGSGATALELLTITDGGVGKGQITADAISFSFYPHDDGAWQTGREFGYSYADNRWFSETSLHLATNNTFLIGKTTGAADVNLIGINNSNRITVGDQSTALLLDRYEVLLRGSAAGAANINYLRMLDSDLADQGRVGFVDATNTLYIDNRIVGGGITIRNLGSNAGRSVLAGGGSPSSADGAYIAAYGNIHATNPGDLLLFGGSAGRVLLFRAGGAPRLIGNTTNDTTNLTAMEFCLNDGTPRGSIGFLSAANTTLSLANSISGGHVDFVTTGGGLATVNGNTIYHTGNDGAASGLDADLWDGYQFADYLNQGVRTTDSPTFAGITLGSTPLVEPSDVAGFTAGQVVYVDDDGDAQANNYIETSFVIGTTWEEVGPTGSGVPVDNEWTALDAVPADAKALLLKVASSAQASGSAGDATVSLYARRNGSAAAKSEGTKIATARAENEVSPVIGVSLDTCLVPITNRKLDFLVDKTTSAGVGTYTQRVWLIGYIK